MHHLSGNSNLFPVEFNFTKTTFSSRVGVLSHRTPMPIQFFLDLGKYRNYGQIDIMTNSMFLALLDKGPDNNSTLTLYDIRAIKMKANRSNVATIKVGL